MKVAYPSSNAKKAPIGLYVRPASYKQGLGGMCNADEAVALSVHKTSYSMHRILWFVVVLSLAGMAFYAWLFLPMIGIPNAY